MRITDCDNIKKSLECKVDRVLRDKCVLNKDNEYDATLYLQFETDDIPSDRLAYAILFNTDYVKSSNEMHKLITTLMQNKLVKLCDDTAKEYLFKVHGIVFGMLYVNGSVEKHPYKLVNAFAKSNINIVYMFDYENN